MGGRNTWTKAGGGLLGSPQPGTAISSVPPQAATEPERPRLTPHPWSLRGPQPPSKRLFLLVSTPPPGTLDLGLCGFLEVAGNWMLQPYGHSLHNYVFNCTPLSSFFKPM